MFILVALYLNLKECSQILPELYPFCCRSISDYYALLCLSSHAWGEWPSDVGYGIVCWWNFQAWNLDTLNGNTPSTSLQGRQTGGGVGGLSTPPPWILDGGVEHLSTPPDFGKIFLGGGLAPLKLI